MKRILFPALLAGTFFVPIAQGDWVYKWTDEEGNVTYQELPPKGDITHFEKKEFVVETPELLTVPNETDRIKGQPQTKEGN